MSVHVFARVQNTHRFWNLKLNNFQAPALLLHQCVVHEHNKTFN